MALDWLLFDIGGVLEIVDDTSWPALWEMRWSAEVGLAPDEFRARMASADLPDVATRSGVAEQWWQGLATAVGADENLLARMRTDHWDAYCGIANSELLAWARAKVGQVGLAILSNSGDGAREEEERRFGFSRIFDPICYSHEIGASKPGPAAYLAALRAMDARPDEVLFVDDAATAVIGARACGIRSVLHVDNATTIAALEQAMAD
jgi:HAD superfamily hydrolase (TIGR01509 family)